jgi:hypothetical protein
MAATFDIVLPIFGLIALGWLAARTGLLGERTGDGLSDFVFVVAVPVLLFRTLATADLPDVPPWGYWMAYFSALAAVWALSMAIGGRMFGLKADENTLAGFGTAQSNTVFVGIPLILRAFGDQAAVPIFLLIAVHLPITVTLATVMIESAGSGQRLDPLAILRRLATHPILIGIAAGVAYRLTGLPIPASAGTVIRLLAETAGPCALFALGMTLVRYGLGEARGMVAVATTLKLLIQPAFVYVLAFHVLAMPPLYAGVAVLFAACPTGVNAYILAQRYGRAVALTSSTIAASTLFAVATMTFWVFLVAPGR